MNADFFYQKASRRWMVAALQKTGLFRLTACFLRSVFSRPLIDRYIKDNHIDMAPFKEQRYDSFASFFARSMEITDICKNPDVLISPCDGLLSVYPITEEMTIPMKGSFYRLKDLIPSENASRKFQGGLCLVFRLQASDYHHFCAFDDMKRTRPYYIPGQLHSVQPIACEAVPVFRLNRRWWCLLKTRHFGPAAQIEIGAMVVGGVHYAISEGSLCKGDEMGNFELAGSTIVLLLNDSVRRQLVFSEEYQKAMHGHAEVPVKIGKGIGKLCRITNR